MKTLAVISLLALLMIEEEQAFLLDALSVAQHPICSSSGTAFCDSTLEDIRLSVRRTGDGGSSVFHTDVFEPGGPQRENACGLFMLAVVCVAAK